MPYKIRKADGKFEVINSETGDVKGSHSTRKQAIEQMRALYVNEPSAEKFIKIGNRNNASDRATIQAIHDAACALGAECMDMEDETEETEAEEKKVEAVPAEVKQVEPERLNLSYVKSLGVVVPEMAVKFVGKDTIKGYTFLWGNDKATDLEVEYFTKNTNFWDDVLGKSPRPLTWDHAQGKGEDTEMKEATSPIIGNITDFGDDEVGRWYTAVLDRSNKYLRAVTRLINQGRLGTSSDSAPQYVERVKTGKATWLKTWAWFASALTDTPAEPRMIGSLEILKSLGVSLPETGHQWQNYTATSDYLKIKYRIGD